VEKRGGILAIKALAALAGWLAECLLPWRFFANRNCKFMWNGGVEMSADINHDLIVSMQAAYIEWKRGILGKWEMDNDVLINQARSLCAALSVEQHMLSIDNKARFDRLDLLATRAYRRYQRRLNRCALCYQHQIYDCKRDGQSRCKKTNQGIRESASSIPQGFIGATSL